MTGPWLPYQQPPPHRELRLCQHVTEYEPGSFILDCDEIAEFCRTLEGGAVELVCREHKP